MAVPNLVLSLLLDPTVALKYWSPMARIRSSTSPILTLLTFARSDEVIDWVINPQAFCLFATAIPVARYSFSGSSGSSPSLPSSTQAWWFFA
jgi:hypothetical protein